MTGGRGQGYGQRVTANVRKGLGVVCVALMALLASLATANGTSPEFSDAARAIGSVLGIFGLGIVAVALFRD